MGKLKFSKSLLTAIKGLFYGISTERNLKIQLLIGLFVISLAILLKIPKFDFVIVLLVSFLVIILELLNTCLERMIDIISPKYNKEFGKLKDIMAGVVLLSVILSVIIGILVFYGPLINALKN